MDKYRFTILIAPIWCKFSVHVLQNVPELLKYYHNYSPICGSL